MSNKKSGLLQVSPVNVRIFGKSFYAFFGYHFQPKILVFLRHYRIWSTCRQINVEICRKKIDEFLFYFIRRKNMPSNSGVVDFTAGGVGGILQVLVGHPFDTLKVFLSILY